MQNTFRYTDELVIEDCPSCFVSFAYPKQLDRTARDNPGPNGHMIYCPNGHSWHYNGQSAAEIERQRADRAEAKATRLLAALDGARTAAAYEERRNRALKGHLTRLKRRIAEGKCPCCHEHFPDVREHIAAEHATWAAEHVDALT